MEFEMFAPTADAIAKFKYLCVQYYWNWFFFLQKSTPTFVIKSKIYSICVIYAYFQSNCTENVREIE